MCGCGQIEAMSSIKPWTQRILQANWWQGKLPKAHIDGTLHYDLRKYIPRKYFFNTPATTWCRPSASFSRLTFLEPGIYVNNIVLLIIQKVAITNLSCIFGRLVPWPETRQRCETTLPLHNLMNTAVERKKSIRQHVEMKGRTQLVVGLFMWGEVVWWVRTFGTGEVTHFCSFPSMRCSRPLFVAQSPVMDGTESYSWVCVWWKTSHPLEGWSLRCKSPLPSLCYYYCCCLWRCWCL